MLTYIWVPARLTRKMKAAARKDSYGGSRDDLQPLISYSILPFPSLGMDGNRDILGMLCLGGSAICLWLVCYMPAQMRRDKIFVAQALTALKCVSSPQVWLSALKSSFRMGYKYYKYLSSFIKAGYKLLSVNVKKILLVSNVSYWYRILCAFLV